MEKPKEEINPAIDADAVTGSNNAYVLLDEVAKNEPVGFEHIKPEDYKNEQLLDLRKGQKPFSAHLSDEDKDKDRIEYPDIE